jgi:hypothetical protein
VRQGFRSLVRTGDYYFVVVAITHHVHITEMNADSYRLKHARGRRGKTGKVGIDAPTVIETVDPETGDIETP